MTALPTKHVQTGQNFCLYEKHIRNDLCGCNHRDIINNDCDKQQISPNSVHRKHGQIVHRHDNGTTSYKQDCYDQSISQYIKYPDMVQKSLEIGGLFALKPSDGHNAAKRPLVFSAILCYPRISPGDLQSLTVFDMRGPRDSILLTALRAAAASILTLLACFWRRARPAVGRRHEHRNDRRLGRTQVTAEEGEVEEEEEEGEQEG